MEHDENTEQQNFFPQEHTPVFYQDVIDPAELANQQPVETMSQKKLLAIVLSVVLLFSFAVTIIFYLYTTQSAQKTTQETVTAVPNANTISPVAPAKTSAVPEVEEFKKMLEEEKAKQEAERIKALEEDREKAIKDAEELKEANENLSKEFREKLEAYERERSVAQHNNTVQQQQPQPQQVTETVTPAPVQTPAPAPAPTPTPIQPNVPDNTTRVELTPNNTTPATVPTPENADRVPNLFDLFR